MIEAEIITLLNSVRKELVSVNEAASIIGAELRDAKIQITVDTPPASKAEEITSSAWLGDGSKLRTDGTRAMKKWRSEIEWHEQPTVEQKWIFLSGYEAGRRAQSAESPSS